MAHGPTASSGAPLMQVTDLTVTFSTPSGPLRAVDRASFHVSAGETLGIVGESGSGKSVSTQTILGLNRAHEVSGSARFDGRDLLTMHQSELRRLRGSHVGMIFQDPQTSLHPLYRVGWQIEEAVRAHETVSKRVARNQALELLELVDIPDPARRIDSFPHELSGGQRQRVLIAMAVALRPRLLIADEPTTALDATVQAKILTLLRNLQCELDMGMIFITHDLAVIQSIAHRVTVMYGGRVVESGDVDSIIHRPQHPYTRGLLEAIPSRQSRRGHLAQISRDITDAIRAESSMRETHHD